MVPSYPATNTSEGPLPHTARRTMPVPEAMAFQVEPSDLHRWPLVHTVNTSVGPLPQIDR